MAIITFKGNGPKETGNTSVAVAIATSMAIEHNIKILLISTSLNDDAIKECFWQDTQKKVIQNGQVKMVSSIQSGIEGLATVINSGKVEPRIIRDYTNVVLSGRFDVLLGYKGGLQQYKDIQKIYPKLIKIANQYYDRVIVDVDKKLATDIQEEIISVSDVIVATTSQKVKDIQRLNEYINQNQYMNEGNTLITIGRYDDYLKCNIKNVTRTIFRRKKNINAMPYNGKYYEAMQEAKVIDLFINLLRTKSKKDHGFFFIQEVQRLEKDINEKWEEVQMNKKM